MAVEPVTISDQVAKATDGSTPTTENSDYDLLGAGNFIDKLRVHFPPGSEGTLHINIWIVDTHGDLRKKVVETPTDQYISGEDEIVEFTPNLEVKQDEKVRAIATNNDATWPHKYKITFNIDYEGL